MTDNPSLPDTGVDAAHDLIMRAVSLTEDLLFVSQHFDAETNGKFYSLRDDMRQWLIDVADEALSARASVAVAVGVKALEWTRDGNKWWSQTAIGRYVIETDSKAKWYTRKLWASVDAGEPKFTSLYAAIESAQSDFATRIRASLTAPVEETVEPVAWRCDECGGRTYALIDERQFDGKFRPGKDRRCVECKKVHVALHAVASSPVAAADAIDAIRKWCEEQRYLNDVITVARLQEMLPPAASTASPSIAGEEARELKASGPLSAEAINARDKFRLWFFRDMSDEQRLSLFAIFGYPIKEIGTVHGHQRKVLNRIFAALTKAEPQP